MPLTPGGMVEAMGSPVASMLVPVMLDGSRMYPGSALLMSLTLTERRFHLPVSDHFTGVSIRMLNLSHWEKLLPVYAADDILSRIGQSCGRYMPLSHGRRKDCHAACGV